MANTSRDLGADAVPVEYLAAGRVAAAPQVAELYILRLASPPPPMGQRGVPMWPGKLKQQLSLSVTNARGLRVALHVG